MTGIAHEGCYICSGKNKYKTTESFKQEVEKKYPDTFEILGEYQSARTPLLVRRKKCGHEHMISPDNILRGKGCPKCTIRQSSYMDKTELYLKEHNISFEKEKRFADCKNQRPLPFDYYLSDYNCCIEVDGEFHYDEFRNTKSKWTLNDRGIHLRDNIKSEYCNDNNIMLIRVPYYTFKTDEYIDILNNKLHVNTEVSS